MRKFRVLPIALLCNGDNVPKPHGTIVTEQQLTGTPEKLIEEGFIEEVEDTADADAKAAAKAAADQAKADKAKADADAKAAKAQADADAKAAAKAAADQAKADVDTAKAATAAQVGNAPDPAAILNQGK